MNILITLDKEKGTNVLTTLQEDRKNTLEEDIENTCSHHNT